MTLLAGKCYDPGTLVTKATTAALAMTAVDTTNLRLSFTVPANGAVLVRQRCSEEGSTSRGTIFFGVLEGSTVRARSLAFGLVPSSTTATARAGLESLYVVPGLTPSASLTWDAAYGVDQLSSSGASLRYGGPNDTTTANANGGFAFEIYECPALLDAKLYDPASQVSKSAASLLAMTAFDTTNLRIAFTAPASGNVLVRIRCMVRGSAAMPQILLGVLDGSTVRGRITPSGHANTGGVNAFLDGTFVVTGLTPSSSYTWDAAYGVEIVAASSNIVYGGPNDTTANNAGAAFQYEIWEI